MAAQAQTRGPSYEAGAVTDRLYNTDKFMRTAGHKLTRAALSPRGDMRGLGPLVGSCRSVDQSLGRSCITPKPTLRVCGDAVLRDSDPGAPPRTAMLCHARIHMICTRMLNKECPDHLPSLHH